MREPMTTNFAPGDEVRVVGGYAGGKIVSINTEQNTATVKDPNGLHHVVSLNMLVPRGADPFKA